RIKYSTLRLNGAWTPPQSLRFEQGVATEESRIIDDPQTGREEIQETERQIANLVVVEADRQGQLNDAEAATTAAVNAEMLADRAKVSAENRVLGYPTTDEAIA